MVISSLVIHDTQIAQISHLRDGHNIYVIMKAMCPPGYHHNSFLCSCTWAHDARLHISGYLPINQRGLNRLNKERNIGGHK